MSTLDPQADLEFFMGGWSAGGSAQSHQQAIHI